MKVATPEVGVREAVPTSEVVAFKEVLVEFTAVKSTLEAAAVTMFEKASYTVTAG